MIRKASEHELGALADLWHDGWQDAHRDILPAELARHRTRESFHRRLLERLADLRVVDFGRGPVGFALTKDDELYQLYVAREARGSRAASLLVTDALERLDRDGVATAWLACAIGNDRAARFYEKSGWIRRCVMTSELETPDGTFSLDVWRYEYSLQAKRERLSA
jgi:GNAT superfamily N-acetyltransferase